MNDQATKSNEPTRIKSKRTDNSSTNSLGASSLAIPAQAPTTSKVYRARLKNNKFAAVLFGVCLVLIIGGVYLFDQASTKKRIQDELETVTNKASSLVAQFKYDEAIGVWQEFLAQPLAPEVKCEADLRFSNVYLESGKYNEANTRFQEVKSACSEVDDQALYLGLAKSYEGFGDIANSIENYQKVIDIEKERQQSPPKGFDKQLSEKNVARYTEIIEVLRLNL